MRSRQWRGWLRLVALAFLCATSASTFALDLPAGARRDPPVQALQRRGVSLDDAVAMVQGRYDAKVVKAETVEQRGRVVHRIRLLSSDGRVWTVSVDAASGEIR